MSPSALSPALRPGRDLPPFSQARLSISQPTPCLIEIRARHLSKSHAGPRVFHSWCCDEVCSIRQLSGPRPAARLTLSTSFRSCGPEGRSSSTVASAGTAPARCLSACNYCSPARFLAGSSATLRLLRLADGALSRHPVSSGTHRRLREPRRSRSQGARPRLGRREGNHHVHRLQGFGILQAEPVRSLHTGQADCSRSADEG